MGIPVIIYGKSGAGKTRSLKNFAEDEIFHVNVMGKLPPFRKKFKYSLKTDNPNVIRQQLLKMPLKTAVIDDVGYTMTNNFMRGHVFNEGSNGYTMFNQIAGGIWMLFETVEKELPEDVIVYFIFHEEYNADGSLKLRTIGKLLDEKVCIEGMTTIVIRCANSNGLHTFQVHSKSGFDITKTPEDMFEEDEIENDLKKVDTTIRKYYGFTTDKQEDN